MADKKVLLVEGGDDKYVLKHLCCRRNVNIGEIEIETCGSVEQLLESFPVRLRASEEGDIVGLVMDADLDLGARWQSVRDRLIKVGYQGVMKQPDPKGTILDPPADGLLPRVGIWIMPDNRSAGILEDFLRFLVPQDSRLYAHVQASVDTIPEGEQCFKASDKAKALIHTWLAWQEEPGKPFGIAIKMRYLDPDLTAQADVLLSWLQRLYKCEDSTSRAPESQGSSD